ncbi:uncharacterized protein K460DRAFT_407434 [Cucurbitaria berberidis CBS 394.84]|uniref:Uncharacterized protein n=1 Tax=Cucurbitaria berberidis CBS 394.84 TaxID=1168544 RepID=A0A9P4GCE7_9PLEO|nr:uncharacterized protein K460DRAFT_407434 [Cucurbitaria berberidis CBS 394.84]KAF1843062.1 hypothetical protein K460DRAFT_407434 [Cucurbitaria berberidis CBS 394.84]
MSTHFRPRPPTITPSSPIRPSTARSTVRAVTPSPPSSFENFQLQHASQGRHARSKSEDAQNGNASGSRGAVRQEEKQDFREFLLSTESGTFSNSPVVAPGPSLWRGGIASGRSSPGKVRPRSRSPRKRPVSTPTKLLSPTQEVRVEEQKREEEVEQQEEAVEEEEDDVGNDDSEDEEFECPDTPTPISRFQKRSAYIPLGTPLALFSNREQQKKSREIVHACPCPPPPPTTTDCLTAPRVHDQRPPKSQTPTFVFQPEPSPPSPQHPQPKAQDVPITTTTARIDTPPLPPRQATVQKPLPANEPARHISLSAQSNVSGGTAGSKRSVFSTPGRDELERKKALVEADEGPFARAVSVQDLQERRRMVSGGKVEGKGVGGVIEEGNGGEKSKKRICGIGVGRCNVM